MSILIQLVICAAIFAGGLATGIKWEIGIIAARDLKATNEAALVKLRRDEKVDAAAESHEQVKAAQAVREVIVEKEIAHVVQDVIYRNQCFTDDGLRIIADDLAARGATGQPTPAVPGVAGASKD
jgi:hypothetical protein